MSGNKVVKPTSYNKTNEEDRKILKHVEKKNYNGYVKKLILADMNDNQEEKKKEGNTKKEQVIKQAPLTAAEKLEKMKEKLKAGSKPASVD
ncbi:MAG: hypothetical protein ACRD8Z_19260 [Nitrososphaeraceae archaeon]